MVVRHSSSALASFFLVMLLARTANASGAMGLSGLAELVVVVVGGAALLLSISLGALSWWTALRPPTAVGWIFARGFLGVSAVFAFGVAGLCLAFALTDWLKRATPLFIGAIVVLAMVFLAVEFVIAGKLYGRSHAYRASAWAQFLRVVSFTLAALFSVSGALVLVFVLIDHFASSTPEPSPTGGRPVNNGGMEQMEQTSP